MTELASCAAAIASLPSGSTDVGKFSLLNGLASRTVNGDLDLFINAFHFVTNVLRQYSCLLAV